MAVDDPVAARIEALEHMVALLSAEREILRTMSLYGHAIDIGDEATWVDCFTADGVFDVRRRALASGTVKAPVRCEGRTELAAFAAAHSRPPSHHHAHTVGSQKLAVEGDMASVVSKFARIDADSAGTPYVASFGLYHDRFVRCADGRWRIAERVAEVQGRAAVPAPATVR
jgi:ketosteroid isomerase-like protein